MRMRVADRIQKTLALPFNLEGHDVFTSASVGIAVGAREYDSPEAVLRDADTALYRAKALGKARYEVFDIEMRDRAVARLRLDTDLRRAIERREFQLYYQPIVSLERRHASKASRRCCAGRTGIAASSIRPTSSRSPRRPD